MRNIVSENQEREKAAKQEELNPRDSTLMVSGGHAALHRRCSAPHRITAQRRQAEKAVVTCLCTISSLLTQAFSLTLKFSGLPLYLI